MNLKTRLRAPEILVAPGVYDGLSAHVAALSGAEAIYLSGASLAYTRFGGPDLGLVSMSEVAECR
jgi:2-methylisocitrate lyase-like PEP mutase family enzyme